MSITSEPVFEICRIFAKTIVCRILTYVQKFKDGRVHIANKGMKMLTLCILVLSNDNLTNSLDPDQARQNVRPDLDPNCLTL